MEKIFSISKEDYSRLKNYFQEYEIPCVRLPRPGDTRLYIGVAVVLSDSSDEKYYVSKSPVRFYSDYYENKKEVLSSCLEAKKILNNNLPSLSIWSDNNVVCALEEGFKDLDGLLVRAITFPGLLAVSLVQHYFDDHGIPIVFLPRDGGREWGMTMTSRDVCELRSLHDLPEHLKKMMTCERLPVGSELCRVLQEWYPYSINCTHRGSYLHEVFRFMGWAAGGRAHQVLEYLDGTSESINHKIAFRIREIGTWDRSGGGMAAAMAYGLYGWFGKELGNRTWSRDDPKWYWSCGEARRALDRRYPEFFRNKVTEGEGLTGIDELVDFIGANEKLFERVYDVLLDSDNPKHRIRAITAISRLLHRRPGMLRWRIRYLLSRDFKAEPIEFAREVARVLSVLYLLGQEKEDAVSRLKYFIDNFEDEELIRLSKIAMEVHTGKQSQ
ncbi:hypothetical protein [Oryzomonas rubra]|uniref:Uncharacterized protein n=1 Tax=Oryzomonas rubra TaxID=2509454 RepID=A0A5A9XLV4_9BACT|nr:hypothetical protein [Oryzomonas rubra]KAA0894076.1 hypothetical protein ET418_03695 [Oryzomonas rubra]